MNREIIIGKRILFLECMDEKACKIYEEFLRFLLKNESYFEETMDEYDIPEQLNINFKKDGKGLAGKYYVQKEEVKEHVIIIDIYTDVVDLTDLKEVVDTFVHEIVHHKIKSDRETSRTTNKIIKELFK